MVLSTAECGASRSAGSSHRKGIAVSEPDGQIPFGVYDGVLVRLSDLGTDGVRTRFHAALLDFGQLPYGRQRLRAAALKRCIVLEFLWIRSQRGASVLSGAV